MEEINTEKLHRFAEAVNADVDRQVKEILSDAETKRRTIIEDANARSAETAEKYYSDNIKKVSGKYLKEASKLELDSKKDVLRHREELTDKVFAAVAERLGEYRRSADYAVHIKKLIADCSPEAGDSVYLSPDDIKLTDLLKKDFPDVQFESDEHIRLGGVSVFSKKGGTIADKTFDAAVSELRRDFAGRNSFAE